MNEQAVNSTKDLALQAGNDPIAPLRDFVIAMTRLVERTRAEAEVVPEARELLRALIADDAWLPEACTVAHEQYYQQHLLHCDPLERFSVVSFVWGPGQATPVHDHTVWGLVGVLRGAERCQRYRRDEGGRWVAVGAEQTLERGAIDAVSPTLGDVHRVANAHADRVSISIHVYGANIGAVSRHVYVPDSSGVKPFVSGYSSTQVPNLWDRSSQVRQSLQERP